MANHPNRGKYQGHKNWNHWNVSLWINNDEGLYWMAQRAKKTTQPAEYVLQSLQDAGITHTPDGAPYSVATIRAAMRGM